MFVKSAIGTDKKDVKSNSVLSKSMSAPPASPVTRVVEDYVGVFTADGKEAVQKTDPKGKELVRSSPNSEGNGSFGGQGLGVPKIHPLLAGLGFKTAEDAKSFLRQELLESRREGSLADWKHFYLTGSNNVTNSIQDFKICSVVGGTTVSSRIGTTIALRKLRIKLKIRRTLTGVSTVATDEPTIHIIIYRDKIPTTVGTAPTIIATDTNPPSSTTAMFSALAVGTPDGYDVAVRNPITETETHIYKYLKVNLSKVGAGYTYTGTSIGKPPPVTHMEELDIDLNEVQQRYASYSAADPNSNALWMSYYTPTSYTNQGFSDDITFACDVEFRDVQD